MDDNEPALPEEPARVQGRDSLLPRRGLGLEHLDRIGIEAGAQARERAYDLGPVAAQKEVRGPELVLGHCEQHSQRSVATEKLRPSDSILTRPSRSVR